MCATRACSRATKLMCATRACSGTLGFSRSKCSTLRMKLPYTVPPPLIRSSANTPHRTSMNQSRDNNDRQLKPTTTPQPVFVVARKMFSFRSQARDKDTTAMTYSSAATLIEYRYTRYLPGNRMDIIYTTSNSWFFISPRRFRSHASLLS